MCVHVANLAEIMAEGGQCLSMGMTMVYVSLAAIDGCIAIAASIQLLRLHLHNRSAGWTRQKVFHCMIGVSNFGYALYFIMNPIAACYGWACWSNVCGFLVIAAPQIIFLATFLLLLSFWVDLCHQATDREEEEDEGDEENDYEILPSCANSRSNDKPRWCCLTFKQWRIRGRQKFVVLLVLGIFVLTSAFAALIWYGTGDNPIDSATMAEVYADLFAFVVLLSGGGLASYGLLLYSKMCKVKTGKSSADIRKVAGLALAAVVCFSLRAFLVLFGDIPVINIWHWELQSHICPLLTVLYYVIGEAIPSIVILCVMREMPPRSRNNNVKGKTVADLQRRLNDQSMVPDSSLFPQWTISATGQSSLTHPARSSSDISISRNELSEENTRAVASG